MIFSVGAGYFMVLINGESPYSQALANRTQGLQSKLVESLRISLLSGASNPVIYTATNVGGTAANITDVFVLDPSGVTHTYGLGFGGSNTTPALPGGVTPQKTSASYDTGITIVPGTYTIKVITHRGNAYTATYPPVPTSFASSTGSLTVDLSSFRWVQLTGTSSINQENYVANCNAALCGVGFSSNVASGDTLVYAVGWANHIAPATPTDTRGNTFTLGAANTVTTPSTTPPTLVQQRYTSNCASSLCGLAYCSNVASGNTLVFGLGWSVVAQYYVPITLTNNQGSATPTTFQQKITWNPSTYSAYESSTLGNIRFCADILCATTFNAWLESCTPSCTTSATSASAWVKLTSAIAASGGTQTVYMAFLDTSVDFDGNFWGEAPTIPGTYGQNDNGANVFNFYDNFAGTSLSVKWTVVKSSGGSVTVNNGATFTTGSAIDYAFVDSAPQTYPQVAESYMVSRTGFTALALGITTSNSVNGGIYPYNGYVVVLFKFSGVDYLALGSETSAGSSTVSFQAEPNFNAGIWQISWSSSPTMVQSATDGSISLSGTSGSPAI